MNFKQAAATAREIARDWGIVAVNFQHVDEGRMPPEECAESWLRLMKDINARCTQLQAGLNGRQTGEGST